MDVCDVNVSVGDLRDVPFRSLHLTLFLHGVGAGAQCGFLHWCGVPRCFLLRASPFFLSPKPFRDHQNSLTGHVSDVIRENVITQCSRIFFLYGRTQKGTALHDGVGSWMFFFFFK